MWASSRIVCAVSRPSSTSANVSAHRPQLLGHLTRLRRVEGGRVVEQRRGGLLVSIIVPHSLFDADQTTCGPSLVCRCVRSHGQVIRAHTMRRSVVAVSRYTGPRAQKVQQTRGGGSYVEEAVVGSREAVEREGNCRPHHCDHDREAVAAPLGSHPAAPGEVDGGPDDEQVNRPEAGDWWWGKSGPCRSGEINACVHWTA